MEYSIPDDGILFSYYKAFFFFQELIILWKRSQYNIKFKKTNYKMPRILFCSLRRGTHPGHMHTRVLMQSENGGDSSGYLQRSPLGGKPGDDVPIFLEVTVKFQVLNAEHVLILQSGKNSNKLLSIIILREGRHFH